MKYEQTYGRKTKEIALNYSRSSYCNRCGRNNHNTSQCFANLNKLNKFSYNNFGNRYSGHNYVDQNRSKNTYNKNNIRC